MKANIIGIKKMEFKDKKTDELVQIAKLQIVSSFPLSDSLSKGLSVSDCSIDFKLSADIPVPCSAILDFDSNGRLLDLDIISDEPELINFR